MAPVFSVDMRNEIKEILKNLGCPKSICIRGAAGLVADWENFANSIANGSECSLDYYLNRIDGRLILFILESQFGDREEWSNQNYFERVRTLDSSFKSALNAIEFRNVARLPDSIGWVCSGIPHFVQQNTISNWTEALEAVQLPSL